MARASLGTTPGPANGTGGQTDWPERSHPRSQRHPGAVAPGNTAAPLPGYIAPALTPPCHGPDGTGQPRSAVSGRGAPRALQPGLVVHGLRGQALEMALGRAALESVMAHFAANHLTEHGVMDAAMLYESPFTDLTPRGPDGRAAG